MPEAAEAEHVLYCVARDADWLYENLSRIDPTNLDFVTMRVAVLKLTEAESYLRTRQSTRRVA